MVANPWRGEVAILLGDNHYVLRPTFSALSNIEQTLGTGLVALAGKLSAGVITLEELSVIIAECAIMPPDAKELIHGNLAGVIESVSRMFAMIFGGHDES